MFYVEHSYPPGAAHGSDFFSGAAPGEIIEDRGGDVVVRPERVLVSEVDVPFEGRLCVGERTVRHMAHLLGLVDQWRVDALRAENARLARELERESLRVVKLADQVTKLRKEKPVIVRPGADGREHASPEAAAETPDQREERVADLVRPVSADEAPAPAELEGAQA